MGMLRFFRPTMLIGLLLAAPCACMCREGDPQAEPAASASPDWPGARLPETGWVAVPLVLGKGHLFEVDAAVGSDRLVLLLDCGASFLVLDTGAAARLKLPLQPAENLGGLGTARATSHVTQVDSLTLGPFTAGPVGARVLDLSAVNESRTSQGDRPIDGLIGASYLIDYAGVISYPARTLYVRPRPAAQPKEAAPKR